MPEWILPAIGFAAAMAASLLGRMWLMRRWLADGMSARRAAAWSMAMTYVPLLALVGVWNLFSGGAFEPLDLVIAIAALSLPILYGFGLRYAVLDYAEKYGVREHERRRLKEAGRRGKEERGSDRRDDDQ